MREIKFKGKSIHTGEWICGSLLLINDKAYICQHDCDNLDNVVFIEVDSKTVSQYTGLKDKNEKEIYENDIVKIVTENKTYFDKVMWVEDEFLDETGWYFEVVSDCRPHMVEIVGNIFDNPDLLEGDKNVKKTV